VRLITPYASGVEVRLSCDHIELKHLGSGLRIRGDIGLLWGNEAGLVTERRAYLFNHSPTATITAVMLRRQNCPRRAMSFITDS